MKKIVFLLLLFAKFGYSQSEARTIHVFVALCDNENQGIVPVPEKIGNGQDPYNNLYWGALYGVKSYFKNSSNWVLVLKEANPKSFVLERILFKHKNSETYLLAEAYDGKFIEQATIDFLEAASGCSSYALNYKDKQLKFGGDSNLVSYIGHDGLIEFDVEGDFYSVDNKQRDAIILACVSKSYFKPYLERTKANPIVWSTGLMSTEAYTLNGQ